MGGKIGNPENTKLHRMTAGRRPGSQTVVAKPQNEVSTSTVDGRNIAPVGGGYLSRSSRAQRVVPPGPLDLTLPSKVPSGAWSSVGNIAPVEISCLPRVASILNLGVKGRHKAASRIV